MTQLQYMSCVAYIRNSVTLLTHVCNVEDLKITAHRYSSVHLLVKVLVYLQYPANPIFCHQ